MTTSRFECPSNVLSLDRLFGATRQAFWIAFGGALLVHLSLSQIAGFKSASKVAKPLTTQFIKRQPRLTKPLELKKRPRPKRRRLQRQMVAVKARIDRKDGARFVTPGAVLRGLAKPKTDVQRTVGLPGQEEAPQALAARIVSAKNPQGKIDATLEMVDIAALDTGQYHAMVIQDPDDKRNVKGFFHFYLAHPVTATKVNWHSDRARVDHGMVVLVAAMNKYTQIKTDIAGRITFDSKELFKTPWVYCSAPPRAMFELTGSEAANLGTYLLSGGFLFADGFQWKGVRGDMVMRNMIRDALAAVHIVKGKDWNFEALPNSHPVYHCYFDFDGPPKGSQPGTSEPEYPLDGVHQKGRLIGIMSNRWYASPWGNWGWWPGYKNLDNTRQVQFGVNLIIFALTQEGSITSQVMDVIH